MAEVGVEPRRGPGIWPWIAGILIVALLVWGLTSLLGGDDHVVVEQAVPAAPAQPR
jgi:hypothetical protein